MKTSVEAKIERNEIKYLKLNKLMEGLYDKCLSWVMFYMHFRMFHKQN